MRIYESFTDADITELEESLDWTDISDFRHRTRPESTGDDTLFGSLAEDADLPRHLRV